MNIANQDAKQIHEKRKFSYEKVNDYHQQFINIKDGKFYDHLMEYRNCPVCVSDRYSKQFECSGGVYVKCDHCSMTFTNPVFSESALINYYQNLDTGQAQIVDDDKAFYRKIYTMGLNAINKHKKIGSVCDIGCSHGFFLDVAKEQGWKTFGIELGVLEGELCQKKGHVLYNQLLETLDVGKKFDVITLWDVFEHMPDGQKQIEYMISHLADDGIIFLQIPNAGSIAARILREKCKMFDGLEHVNLYNPKTIALLAEECGLQILHIETIISEIGVLNNYLDGSDPYFGSSKYSENLLGFISEKSIHENLLGYKMQIVMKRKS